MKYLYKPQFDKLAAQFSSEPELSIIRCLNSLAESSDVIIDAGLTKIIGSTGLEDIPTCITDASIPLEEKAFLIGAYTQIVFQMDPFNDGGFAESKIWNILAGKKQD